MEYHFRGEEAFGGDTCKNAKDSRILFKAFRKIKSHSCSSPDSHFCLEINSKLVFEAFKQAQIFSHLFSWDQLQNPIPFTYGPSANEELNLPFDKVELFEAIRRTKATTLGQGRIPASFFKGLIDHSLDLLFWVYNSILFSGEIPPSWTSADTFYLKA